MNLSNNKNNINVPNYQISGIEPNYVYNGVQNLPFDQSSISTSGHVTKTGLEKAVEQQQQFVNNYNSYRSLSTFDNPESNSANLENLKNFSQFRIDKGFETNKPILFMPNNTNKHETLYDNLNENLLRESIKEYRLNIDSIDRDIKIYPDPFDYIVHLGPVTNSNINTIPISKNNIKQELKTELKNQNKKNQNIQKKYIEQELEREKQLQEYNNINQNEIFIFNNPDAIKDYTVKLTRSFNPYIIRDFKNISYVKLDCAVIPKYTSICINRCWDFCRKNNHKKNSFRDEYDRIKDYLILNDRYIPNEQDDYNPLGDRFIQIYIKELQSIRNFGTNPTTDKSFLLIYDKTLGALYLKLIPYSATKTYKDSLLGNLTKLSIQFYDSWGNPLTINTKCIDYEINQISNTNLIDPSDYLLDNMDLNNIKNNIKYCVKNFNEIIKCFIIINYNISHIIPFYTNEKYCEQIDINDIEKIKFHEDCFEYKTIIINEKIFEVKNIYNELNSFVSLSGFIETIKISKSSKKIKLNIDEYIKNVIWFDFNEEYIDKIIHNIKSFDHNYRNFGFKILDILKTEIINIPTNKNFQNFLTFLIGVWEDELNTKIDYYN